METKELKIQVPKGYEIDKEKSTFEKIVFKKKEEKRWRDNESATVKGYYIGIVSGSIVQTQIYYNNEGSYNIFATKKQAKSALAMARISQIMANDERFGGVVTDAEWNDKAEVKYCIDRAQDVILQNSYNAYYCFLAFHTKEQCDLFLEENEDLVRDYLML